MEPNPNSRIDAKDALSHPWFISERPIELISVIDQIKKYNKYLNNQRKDI